MAKCLLAGRTYEVFKPLEKNCFFFKDLQQISKLFVPLLAFVTEVCGLVCHDYFITPHGYKVIWTTPKLQPFQGSTPKLQPFRRSTPKVRSKQAKRLRKIETRKGQQRKKQNKKQNKRAKKRSVEPRKRLKKAQNRIKKKTDKEDNEKSKKKRVQVIAGGIPKAMELLNGYLDRYVKITRGLTGPIFRRNYKDNYDLKLITSEADAIRAHVEFRVFGQSEGYSADNDRFGEAILNTERIGDTAEIQLIRPSCVGNNSKIGHNLAISFPLMADLQRLSAQEVQNQINNLVEVARELIEEQKQAEDREGYLEEDIAQLPEPPTPRPSYEIEEDYRTRIDFDTIRAFAEQIQQELRQQREEADQANEQFQQDYKRALRQWRQGNRTIPFPTGTYKMRVLHNCRIRQIPALE